MDFGSYRNYVFDLYGTLIDVRHDEGDPAVWRKLSDWYAVYGADIAPEDLHRRYLETIRLEEERIGKERGCAYPEADLLKVFLAIYENAEEKRAVPRAPQTGEEKTAWAVATSNFFRIVTRLVLENYVGASALLGALKKRGKRIFLLSNAQTSFTLPEIEVSGLLGYFDGMRLSSDHGVKKPERAFFSDMMTEYGMNARDTVLIGNDLFSDMQTAVLCGVAGVYIDSYRKSGEEISRTRGEFIARDGGEENFLALDGIGDLIAYL
ncbi:MAG: HAD family hydrolase [Clostridia bacterium]|nr:HAD family hydrolase [Clostridia bacterium]